MEPKALPPAKISSLKLLGTSSLSTTVKKVSVKSFGAKSEESNQDILIIKKQVIKINDLIKSNTLLKQQQENKKRKEAEKQKFTKREEKLEEKKEPGQDKLKLPPTPKLGFLDRIKNFLFNIILGKIVIALLPNLPKLSGVFSTVFAVQNTIIDYGGKILNGLMTFVDKGYETYDKSRKLAKNFGGEPLLKLFDGLTGTMGKVIEASIIAALAFGELGGDSGTGGGPGRGGGGRPGRDGLFETRRAKRGVSRVETIAGRNYRRDRTTGYTRASGSALSDARIEKLNQSGRLTFDGKSVTDMAYQQRKGEIDVMKKYADRFGRDAAVRRFGEESVSSLGGKYARSGLSNFARKGFVGLAGKGGAKAILGTVRPFLKRIPIPVVGALIDFGLSVALGEDPGRAAFKAIGAGLLGAVGAAVGSVVPFAGTFLGGLAGGVLGDMAGGALYDAFFGNKKPQPQKTQGRAEGGKITRGGKAQTGPRREIKGLKKKGKYTRVIPKKPGQVEISSPGSSVGGEKKILGLFPKPSTPKFASPFDVIKNTAKELGKADYFGPILAISSKITAGQLPTDKDYQNVGLGINLLISKGLQEQQLKGGIVTAFAEGGLVDPDVLSAMETGGDISNWVAKTFKGEIETNAQKTLRMIRENAAKEQEKGKGAEPAVGGGMAGQYSPEGIQGDIYQYLLSKGLSDAHALGIMANISRESGFRVDAKQPNGPGIGLFQYSSAGRKDAFLRAVPDYATNWKGQIDYALKEDAAPRYLQMTFSSPQEAADWWMREWERPAEYIQSSVGPKKHREYLASLERFRTRQGYRIPTSADLSLGSNIGNLNLAKQLAESMGVPLYSHVRRNNPNSYHYDGRAMDFSNDAVGNGTPQQLALAKELVKRYGATAKEIFYTPLGFSIKDGKKVSPIAPAGHYNHVHVAFAKGGKVHGFTKAILGEKGPEFVIDADSTRSLEENYPGFLSALNKADYKGAINVLQNYASYESGAATQVIIDKEIVPILFPVLTEQPSTPVVVNQGSGEDYMAYSYKHG